MDARRTPGEHPGVGTLLAERYRLDQRVGRGGMAEVYRGRDELLDREVAVKVFRFETGAGSEQQRVQSEMRTLAGLRHPGLVMLYDANAGDDDASAGAPFLVMEFVAGPTLSERLSSGALPPAEVARIGADLASALHYVHANGIVHRDVKPANILLDEHPGHGGPAAVKLTDFGIARITDGTRLTADGSTIGTANYLSPEQAQGHPVGPATDVYALGLVLLECLTGAVAYPGTGIEAAVARLSRPPAIPQQLGPEWIQLLGAMTALDPGDRPDARRVAAVLEGMRAGAPTQPVPAPHAAGAAGAAATTALLEPVASPPDGTAVMPAVTPGTNRHRNRVLIAAAAMVVIVVATIAVAMASGTGTGAGTPSPPAGPASAGTSPPTHPPRSATTHPTSPTTSAGLNTRPAPPPAKKTPKPPKDRGPGHGHGKAKGHKPGHGPKKH